jgi:hypothetical protein
LFSFCFSGLDGVVVKLTFNCGQVFAFGHYEEALAVAAFFPELANHAFFMGVVV